MITKIVHGNDFSIKVSIVRAQYETSGQIWVDFDIIQCKDVHVNLICTKHQTVIPLEWSIDESSNNVILCDIEGRWLHAGAVYGLEITGFDSEDRAWRYYDNGLFMVVNNTSQSYMNEDLMDEPLLVNAKASLAVNTILGPQGSQGEIGPQGEIGVQGPQGEIGLTGPQGEIGLTGPQGEIGLTGPQGEIGVQGPIGPQGEIGLTGQQGAIGVQGPIGPQGEKGADGTMIFEDLTPAQKESLRGEQGPQGEIGVQGPIGPQGDKGADGTMIFEDLTPAQKESLRGEQGPQGAIGVQGPIGPQGEKGQDGIIGQDGVQGPQGAIGPQGEIGVQGPQGEIGLTGPQGDKGADGTMIFEDLTPAQKESLRGPQGYQGEKGQDGIQGQDGVQGPQGVIGPQGDIGAIGPQGPQGEKGQDGVQGPQGENGLTGPQGDIGVQGPIGPQGEKGQDGVQGPQGEIGLTGPQGAIGVQGPIGPQGEKGQDGIIGQDGVQGPQGDIGPQGPAGESGAIDPDTIDTVKLDFVQSLPSTLEEDHIYMVAPPLNLKTINNESIVGAGNITVSGGVQGPQGAKGDIGLTGPQGPQGAAGSSGSSDPIYYVHLNWMPYAQDASWQGKQAIEFKSLEVWDLSTSTQVYNAYFSSKDPSVVFGELVNQFGIRCNVYMNNVSGAISHLTFTLWNGYRWLYVPQTAGGFPIGNGTVLQFKFYTTEIGGYTQTGICNTVMIPIMPSQSKMVTSSTNDLKFEIVSSLPATQDATTVYLVTSENALYYGSTKIIQGTI